MITTILIISILGILITFGATRALSFRMLALQKEIDILKDYTEKLDNKLQAFMEEFEDSNK